MRTNLPVTDNEHVMRDDQLIVSRTDLKGRITDFNHDFVDISGFTEQELMGAPQNIIRHPDMPAAAFKDMWDTIQAGKPWTGLVKNRCKNGDFYWVEANVSPLREQAQTIGYISVRRKPSREQIAKAEATYVRLRAGQAAQPLMARIRSRIDDIHITRALPGGLLVITLLFAVALAISLMGVERTAGHLQKITDETQVLEQAYNDLYGDGLQMVAAMRYILIEPADKQARDNLAKANAKFAKELATVRQMSAGDAEAIRLLDDIATQRQQHADIQARVLDRIDTGDLAGAKRLYNEEENVVWRSYKTLIMDAMKAVKATSQEERQASIAAANLAKQQAIGFSIFALLTAALLGVWLVRKIARPLQVIRGHLEAISNSDYSQRIEVTNKDELGEMTLAVKSVQARLDFEIQDTNRIARENLRIRTGLDNVTLPVTLSDDRNKLVYINAAARQLWSGMSESIKRRKPAFDVDTMIGSTLADCFEDQEVATVYRADLVETRSFDMRLADRNLRLTASPVRDADGSYRGRVTQWLDRTSEVTTEQEIANLIQAAASGDFTQRIQTQGKDGFFLQLGDGLNRLMTIVANGLADVAGVLNAIASGDLNRTIEADYEGTFGQVKDDTNTTVARLREVVGQIIEVSDAISTAAGEISSGNSDLSGRTEEQAASLEETASSMEQLNATVKQNAQNADQANQLAQDVNAVATRGGEMVQRVVATMGSIQESSRRIADIISVIDGIAFQTNILALNAAVEAARAGEQGRGFAVVAAEVRSLAQRSAQAAKEIKELITDSVSKVEDGAQIAGQAGDTMEEILNSFRQVTGLVDEITGASREQSTGIEQVTQAVAQMDEVTQQNAALVEQAAAAAESLEDQTRVLSQAISVFSLSSQRPAIAQTPAQFNPRAPVSAAPKKGKVVTALAAKTGRSAVKRMSATPAMAENADEWEEF
ncbi:methyl-accepting chemotaxis protein [Thiocystis violacea]|uniref:methyl-accepting chemotaxis protein n=1 Tax=Thiocystis violacea TaxID=13725 RepID=UPI00190736D5|nr:methyl-accepting chemotaxis protein [Thiocystis violacea]MBK1721488.1 chemotaxis protein [Thiocystis violacea]